MNIGIAGNVRRMDRRLGKLSAFTRAEVVSMLSGAETVDECRRIALSDARRKVQRAAFTRALAIEYLQTHGRPVLPVESESSEFDLLVQKFTEKGSKDPAKSARASLAARAGAKKRQQQQQQQSVSE